LTDERKIIIVELLSLGGNSRASQGFRNAHCDPDF